MAPPKPIREVRGDLICRRCGYNLRGLAVERSCPECGTAIEWTLQGWKLRFANPQWVAALKRGADALCWVSLLSLGQVALLVLAVLPNDGMLLPWIGWLAGITLLVLLRAIWLLTAPEPFVNADAAPINNRRVTRYAGSAAVLVALFVLVRIQVPMLLLRSFDAFNVPAWIAALTPLLAMSLLCQHLRAITVRLPESYVDQGLRSFWFGVGIMVAVTVGLILLAWVGLAVLAIPLLCGFPFAVLIFMIWYMMLAAELSTALAHAARLSREGES